MMELLTSRFVLATVVAVILLLLIGRLAAREQMRRRTQVLFGKLADATPGRLVRQAGPDAGGLAAAIEPAPEPFLQFTIDYRAASNLDLLALALRPVTGRRDRLLLAGRLVQPPVAELIWEQGRIPGQAAGRHDRTVLWVPRRLDVVNAQFAVRGVNTSAIEHVFRDLQARFRPFLQTVSVYREGDPEIQVVLNLNGFNLDDIPALVTSVRGLGRAALRN